MTREKLAKASLELKAGFSSVIIFPLPLLKKQTSGAEVMINNPKTVEEWLTKTNYHPDRGIIVSVGEPHGNIYHEGEVVYFDGTRMKNFTPILHDREVYFKMNIGDILCTIMEGPAKEYEFEDSKESKLIIN